MATARVRRCRALGAHRAPVPQRHRATGHVRADDRTGPDSGLRDAPQAARTPGCCRRAPVRARGGGGADRARGDLGACAVRRARRLADGAVDDIVEMLEDEPFNLSLEGSEDLSSSLADFGDEAFGYAVAGYRRPRRRRRRGVGRRVLYFILRDGAALWAWILGRFARRAGRRSTAPDGTRGPSWPASSGERRSSLSSTRR